MKMGNPNPNADEIIKKVNKKFKKTGIKQVKKGTACQKFAKKGKRRKAGNSNQRPQTD